MATKSTYGDSSIHTLKGPDQVRKKVGVVFGTNDENGAFNGVKEIIANSVDEARAGFGKQIRITVEKTGVITVEDDGRGVPMGWNSEEKEWNWKLVFCTLYSSGKYDVSSYGNALGTNGIGATAMNFASEFFEVWSTREGKTSHIRFEKGLPVMQLEETKAVRDGNGTKISFKPDSEVFSNIKGGIVKTPEAFINVLREQAMLHGGLEFVLNHYELGHSVSLLYNGGIAEFVDAVTEKAILRKAVFFEETTQLSNSEFGNDEMFSFNERIAFNFSREQSYIELFHNGTNLFEGGTTMDAIKAGITSAFITIAKNNGKLPVSGKLTFKDIEQILVCVGDTNAPGAMSFFKNQTKSALSNESFGKEYATFIYGSLLKWEKRDKAAALRVLEEVLINKEAREKAEEVSKHVVRSLSKSVTSLGNKPKKFVDCKSKFVPEKELFIVEGDSAAGSVKQARDSQFQALMPIRGKIINCLKEDLSRVLNSEIVIDLLRIFGCGVEAKSKYIDNLPPFKLANLQWGKIIICTDADSDGMQIRCLVIAFIYKLCPTLLKAGKVYIAETPLYEIIYKGDVDFAYNEAEKEDIIKKYSTMGIPASKLKINRSKGLGENDPDMMSKSTMHPLTRRLVPVEYPADDSQVASTFEMLLGNDLESRKEIIDEYFKMIDNVE